MNDFEKIMNDDIKHIESIELSIPKGTKKMKEDFHKTKVAERNEFIVNRIKEYEELKTKVKEKLDNTKLNMTPKKDEIDFTELKSKIDSNKRMLKLTNKYAEIVDKTGINKIINLISETKDVNLVKINNYIKQFIEIINSYDIKLNLEDFNYSLYTYKYMEVFLNSISLPDFDEVMEKTFNDIFFSCPDLVKELKLMLKKIYDKKEKLITSLFNKKSLAGEYIKDYKVSIDDYYEKLNSNAYYLTEEFLNGTKNPLDYKKDSANYKKEFDKFLFNKTFDELSDIEKDKFYDSILGLDKITRELDNYKLFKPLIDEVIAIYKAKDSLKDAFKTKKKEMDKLESTREKVVSSILSKKGLFKKDNTNNTKLILKQNEAIKNIIDNYDSYIEEYSKNVIITKLLDTSELLDIIKLISSNYTLYVYLYKKCEIAEDIEEFFSKLENFAYEPYNMFTKEINILNELDICEVIANKYKLTNINLNVDELRDNLDAIKLSIKYILDIYYITKANISFDDLNIINEISALT